MNTQIYERLLSFRTCTNEFWSSLDFALWIYSTRTLKLEISVCLRLTLAGRETNQLAAKSGTAKRRKRRIAQRRKFQIKRFLNVSNSRSTIGIADTVSGFKNILSTYFQVLTHVYYESAFRLG